MLLFGNLYLILANKKKVSNFTKSAATERETTAKVHFLNRDLSYFCYILKMVILWGLWLENNIILWSPMPRTTTVWRRYQIRSLTNLIRILVSNIVWAEALFIFWILMIILAERFRDFTLRKTFLSSFCDMVISTT